MSELLNGVDVFVAAVESGSFASASERLSLTRSAVAKTIARVEARLSVRLFHRTTRSLALTDDGQVYYERCVRALEELRAGEAALDSGRREAAGRVRISVPVLFGRRCVAPVLAHLAAEHPKLELEISFSDRTVDLIEEGFDLAIRNGEIGNGAGLMTRTLGLKRMLVCGSPVYLASRGRPTQLEDVLQHTGIVYCRAGRIRTWVFPVPNGSATELTPSSQLRFDDLEAIADAAEAGHGLAWLPVWLIRDRIRAGTLMPLFEDMPSVKYETHALWPEAPHLPFRVRLIIDALASALPISAEL
jgi:DNA-binding transcriptional LysR family regulator